MENFVLVVLAVAMGNLAGWFLRIVIQTALRHNWHPVKAEQNSEVHRWLDVKDVVFPSSDKANQILERLQELITAYGHVSVADYFELNDIPHQYSDNKYGWYDISEVCVIGFAGSGFRLDLPRPVLLAP